jgi:uncharacterized GH25 family protein
MVKRALAGLIAGVCLFGATPALFAHDHWIHHGQYRNPVTGEWCCGEHDCFPVPADKVSIGSAGYTIGHLGETVPYNRVLKSEDGQYWRCHRPDGTRRCFFVPNAGS